MPHLGISFTYPCTLLLLERSSNDSSLESFPTPYVKKKKKKNLSSFFFHMVFLWRSFWEVLVPKVSIFSILFSCFENIVNLAFWLLVVGLSLTAKSSVSSYGRDRKEAMLLVTTTKGRIISSILCWCIILKN